MKYSINQEWLNQKYINDLATIEAIAEEVGCSIHNIKRLLKKWGIRRGRALQSAGLVPAWNKGLTKEDDERLRMISEQRTGSGNPMYGKDSWNKGLTKDDDERVMAISVALTGRETSEETRQRMSEAKTGLYGEYANNWQGGVTYSGGYGVMRETINGERDYKHRHLARVALGRPLTKDDHVHHIDRNKKNNDPKNLIVISSADHNRLHRAIDAGFETPEMQRNWLHENEIEFMEVLIEN